MYEILCALLQGKLRVYGFISLVIKKLRTDIPSVESIKPYMYVVSPHTESVDFWSSVVCMCKGPHHFCMLH